ncbi:hypothetical protein ADEAN_000478700 [Angomonas deanei]|uniref:Uncharacterized protein n=1 Tax=Angomonas deanei TaxID=59799 RepID=A0A7G2CCR0_9TRYP|nr:hypothetical protein ADEAN_000478700 [Angomonas deanei]
MHLSHAIPWASTAANFEFVKENKHVYGAPSTIFPRKDVSKEKFAKSIEHFSNVFLTTLQEFSKTERAKYLDKEINRSPRLFTDDLLDHEKHGLKEYSSNDNRSSPVNEGMQLPAYWKAARDEYGDFCTSNGNLADAVKFMIQRNQSVGLLRLAKVERVYRLLRLSWGHSFGVNHVAYETLRMYIWVNLLAAVQQNELVKKNKSFDLLEIEGFNREVREALTDCDYAAQRIMHWQFWELYVEPVPEQYGRVQWKADRDEVKFQAALRAYMADCFRVLYLYDMFVRELKEEDADAFWREELKYHPLLRIDE